MDTSFIRIFASALLTFALSAAAIPAQDRFFEQVAAPGQQPGLTGLPASLSTSTGEQDLEERLEQVRERLGAINVLVGPQTEMLYEHKARLAALSVCQRQQAHSLGAVEKKTGQQLETLRKAQKEFVDGSGGIEAVMANPQSLAYLLAMQEDYDKDRAQLDQARQVVAANRSELARQQAQATLDVTRAEVQGMLATTSAVPLPEKIASSGQPDPAAARAVTPEMAQRGLRVLQALYPEAAILKPKTAARPIETDLATSSEPVAAPVLGGRASRPVKAGVRGSLRRSASGQVNKVAKVRTGTAFGSKLIDMLDDELER